MSIRILLVVLIRWVVNLTLWRIPGSRVDARGLPLSRCVAVEGCVGGSDAVDSG